ncbi:hypothetical protein [uncultured Nostoc sp.]|uniref:hypothetical protein n=1 Tax=uncultured Nostoc sp. TaxID=340711 RepID=UPI0035CAA206
MKNLTIEQIYLAIRNRGYTNQVRLRGLKKLETHGGGFCLNTVQSSFSSFASFAVACGKPLRVYVKKRILALT